MGFVQRIIDRCKVELQTSFRPSRRTEPTNGSVLRTHLCLQIILILLSGMILDGGILLGIVSFSSLAYWAMVGPVFFRWGAPTRFDTLVIRYGFIGAVILVVPLCFMVLSLIRQ